MEQKFLMWSFSKCPEQKQKALLRSGGEGDVLTLTCSLRRLISSCPLFCFIAFTGGGVHIHVHVYVKVRGQPWISFCRTQAYCFETGSLTRTWVLGVCLKIKRLLLLRCWNDVCLYHRFLLLLLLYTDSGEIRSPCFQDEHFLNWAISTAHYCLVS